MQRLCVFLRQVNVVDALCNEGRCSRSGLHLYFTPSADTLRNVVDAACLRTSNKIGLVYTYRNVDRYSLQALIGNTGVMYISLKLSIYS